MPILSFEEFSLISRQLKNLNSRVTTLQSQLFANPMDSTTLEKFSRVNDVIGERLQILLGVWNLMTVDNFLQLRNEFWDSLGLDISIDYSNFFRKANLKPSN